MQRISGSGPIHLGAFATRRKTRLKMLLLGLSVVVMAAGVLLFARWIDLKDREAQTGDDRSAPVEPRAEAVPPDPASRPRPAPAGQRGPAATPPAPPAGASAAIPIAVVDAGQAAPAAGVLAHPNSRDGGTAAVAQAQRAAPSATPASVNPRSNAPDTGVAVASADVGKPTAAQAAATSRRDGAGRARRDDDDGSQVRVARFATTGGADLDGRVVDADSGRPLSGISVEARLEGRSVEVDTDANGAFKMPGMVPGSKVLLWVGTRPDRMVAERFDIRISDIGSKADIGLIRLLAGDELASNLDGWIGIYLARKDDKVRVSAVNAWGPANRAGIEVGDAVLSVDGRDVKGLGPRSVGFLLRGPSGSSISLEIESGDGKRHKLTLKRVTR